MSRNSVERREVSRTAPIFAALGDETRLELVALTALATAGLVSDVRRGRERIWEFEPKQVEAAQSYLEHVSKRWDKALDRLKNFVEE